MRCDYLPSSLSAACRQLPEKELLTKKQIRSKVFHQLGQIDTTLQSSLCVCVLPETMTTTPTPKLWVLLKNNDSAVVNKPTQVSTKDCENVDDFIEAVKKKLSNKLGQVDSDNITLHTTEDGPALEPDDTLPAQNTKKTALFITVSPPATPSSADPLLKSHRQKSFRKMAVAASCRSFLDAVAKELKVLYTISIIFTRVQRLVMCFV